MAKRELSSTLKNLKFMQRAAQREELAKKQEEVKPEGNFASPGVTRKCVVILEGDPHPGAVIGRMSFQSFNPSVDKLNEAASNLHSSAATNPHPSTSSSQGARMSFSGENGSSQDMECSDTVEANHKENGNLKRKQSEVLSDTRDQSKSLKTVQSGQRSSPSSSKDSFKQSKIDWNVLRPKSQNKQNEWR